ncbi:hypothetical protein CC78DRAFT_613355 [Lojkania enalia]|uniref:Uncharacterized protein n=1 Tax=Lojkania enalia TaxID=147567 RepID=A0A9P4KHG2_9PLEO|nr:hypothetical protein CC78DRAFT_613355 [Didymosphaeria enalia]
MQHCYQDNHNDDEQASKLSKEYEKRGGGCENEPGSKNEPKKGTPKHKFTSKKQEEEELGMSSPSAQKATPQSPKAATPNIKTPRSAKSTKVNKTHEEDAGNDGAGHGSTRTGRSKANTSAEKE